MIEEPITANHIKTHKKTKKKLTKEQNTNTKKNKNPYNI